MSNFSLLSCEKTVISFFFSSILVVHRLQCCFAGCNCSRSFRNWFPSSCCSSYWTLFFWGKSPYIISNMGCVITHYFFFIFFACAVWSNNTDMSCRIKSVAGNHKNIFNDARVPWSEYRYYDSKTVGLDFEGMIADIKVSR